MPSADRPEFRVGAFASSFVLAVFAATVTIVAIAQIELLLSGRPRIVFDAYPVGIFAVVGVVIAFVSVLPAMMASYRRWGLFKLTVAGGVIGTTAILAIILVSQGLNLPNLWAWQAMSASMIFVPIFGLAGLVGGATFGLIQKTLLSSQPGS